MKNVKYIIIIIVLLILNGFLVYKFKLNNKTFKSVTSQLNTELNQKKEEVKTFEQNFIYEKTSENLQLQGNTKLIDVNGDTITLKDIFKKNSIILRYSELNCKDCINAEINALVENKEKLKADIVLLAYYKNKRDLFVFYKDFQKKGLDDIKMYLLPDKGLNIPIDKLNMPFYFSTDSTLTMTNFFIPQKDKPELSKVYLNNILK